MARAFLLTVCIAITLFGLAAQAAPPEQFTVWGAHAKAHKYLGAPGLDTPGLGNLAMDEAQGFVVLRWAAPTHITPDAPPLDMKDLCTDLAAADCPGQYGPVTFIVAAAKPGDFSVAVTDLTGPGGKSIAAENLDVRAVRYAKVTARGKTETIPLLLEKSEKTPVAANRLQQFWITYFIPEGTPAGTYEGKVRIRVGGEEKLALPLKLTVYPFKLAEPEADLYVYYNNKTEAAALPLVAKELIDQRCHGMTVSTLGPPVTRDGDLTREALVPLLDAYKKAGFSGRNVYVSLFNRITCEWLNEPDKSIKMYGPWFRFYPFSEKLDKRYVDTVKMIGEEAAKRKLALVLQVADEAGSHPWTIPGTQHYLDLIRKEVPGTLLELTCGGGWAMDYPEHELWHARLDIWSTNRWLADKLDIVRKNEPKAKIFVYNMAGGGSLPGGLEACRGFYGFFVWNAKACGGAQWTYYHDATPEDNYTWPAEAAGEGNVPTLHWEAAREGAKDRRYIATLEKVAADKDGQWAIEAWAILHEMGRNVELKTGEYDPITGGRIPAQPAKVYDGWRARIAEQIVKLAKP